MKKIESSDKHMAVATSDANRMAGNSVSLKTFNKWQLFDIIGRNSRKVEGTDITEVWCKLRWTSATSQHVVSLIFAFDFTVSFQA